MSAQRAGWAAALAASLCMTAVLIPETARAESGRINAHLELGGALPPASLGGPGTFSAFGGFHLAAKVDYKLHPVVAPQISYIMALHPQDRADSFWLGATLGAKIRFLDDHEGPLYYVAGKKGMSKGNVWGGGWIDANVGWALLQNYSTILVDVGAGYEFSLLDYLQLGPFLSFDVLIPLVGGERGLFSANLGVSFTVGIPADVSTKTDTDEDGLPDDVEDANGNGIVDEDETDPELADTDEDGLDDGDERKYGTDALDPDTDGDGAFDGEEVSAGTDPLDTASSPAFVDEEETPTGTADRLIRGVAVPGVDFDVVDAINPGSEAALDGIATTIKGRTDIALLEVGVHMNPEDDPDPETLRLRSKNRADAVVAELIKRGVPATMLVAKGYGGDEPIDITNPEINERVIIKKLK